MDKFVDFAELAASDFRRYMREVDSELADLGVSRADLASFPFRDYYDAGAPPLETATDAQAEHANQFDETAHYRAL